MSETHHDTHGHGGHAEAEADRANVGVIGLLLASTAIVLAVTSYLLWIYFERETEAITYQQVLSAPTEELDVLRQQENEWLSTYGVVDAEAGRYRVPIDRGMELFLQEASARRSAGRPQVVVAPAAAPAEGEEEAEGEAAEGAADEQGAQQQ